MVGTHTFIGKNSNKKLEQLNFLKHEPWFCVEKVDSLDNISLFMSSYEGYPYKVIKTENWNVIIEGMIYNLNEDALGEKIKTLADLFINDADYLPSLSEFTSLCDGDFVIQIFDKKNGRYLIFNDYFARLPIYYSADKDNLTISRDIKTNLEFASEISIDLSAITGFLMLSYVFGNKTYFKNIKRLEPYQAIVINDIKNPSAFTVCNTNSINYNTINHGSDKNAVLKELVDQFQLDSKNRITKLRENKYDLMSAMSGGFDSRAVLGGLSKFDKKIKYITFEYIQDESAEAGAAFNKLGDPGEYVKLKFNNVIDYSTIEDLVYKTNGSVDFLTTSVCYNDAAALRAHLKDCKRIGHFSGYGGEFLRCPQKKIFRSIYYGLNNRFYNMITLEDTVSVFNQPGFIKGEIKEYYKKEYPVNQEGQLRKFYEEYAKVPQAGEERGRLFNWTVHPMWSKNWIKIIHDKIPLRWTGYKFFIEFLEMIDKRLLDVPIFNRHDLVLNSERSVDAYEKQYRKSFGFKTQLGLFLNYYFPFIFSMINKIRKKDSVLAAPDESIFNDFVKYFDKLEKCNSIFNIEMTKKHIAKFGGKYNRLTTIAIYLSEIEKRYFNKIKI